MAVTVQRLSRPIIANSLDSDQAQKVDSGLDPHCLTSSVNTPVLSIPESALLVRGY